MNRGCVDLESTFEGEPDRTLKEMDQTAVQFFGFLEKQNRSEWEPNLFWPVMTGSGVAL